MEEDASKKAEIVPLRPDVLGGLLNERGTYRGRRANLIDELARWKRDLANVRVDIATKERILERLYPEVTILDMKGAREWQAKRKALQDQLPGLKARETLLTQLIESQPIRIDEVDSGLRKVQAQIDNIWKEQDRKE